MKEGRLDSGVKTQSLGLPFAGCLQVSKHWFLSRDGNDYARELFDRHYSRYFYADGRKPKLFVGPGEKTVLVTENADALFVWRKFIDASGAKGVNCSIFRNEGPVLSSVLIHEACDVAWSRWPGERLYTYVNPRAVNGDGACFKHAGWRKCGRTKARRLIVLEYFQRREHPPTTEEYPRPSAFICVHSLPAGGG